MLIYISPELRQPTETVWGKQRDNDKCSSYIRRSKPSSHGERIKAIEIDNVMKLIDNLGGVKHSPV